MCRGSGALAARDDASLGCLTAAGQTRLLRSPSSRLLSRAPAVLGKRRDPWAWQILRPSAHTLRAGLRRMAKRKPADI